jgi:hypothetical protein
MSSPSAGAQRGRRLVEKKEHNSRAGTVTRVTRCATARGVARFEILTLSRRLPPAPEGQARYTPEPLASSGGFMDVGDWPDLTTRGLSL